MSYSTTAGHGKIRAARMLVAVIAAVSMWSAPGTTLGSDSSSGPAPALTDTSTYTSLCPEPAPGQAGCFVLARTDVAARTAGEVSPATGPSGYSPADLQSAYNLPSTTAGAGLTVAIVDAYDVPDIESALGTYRAQFGLPACTTGNGCFRKVDEYGGANYASYGPSGSWANETALDVEMVSAVCPLCNILLVESASTNFGDLGQAEKTAVALGANAVSNSYGTSGEPVGETSLDVYFNHPGVVITASSGDCGYNSHLSPCAASSPEYPASSPWVVSVGGTSLQTAGNSRGWTESAWSGAGSGCSLYEVKPYWQSDSGCAKRTSTDISAVANPNTGVAVYDTHGSGGAGWYIYGGTSASSPIVAAAFMVAGRPAPDSYPFRRMYSNAASINDVTTGNNGSCSGSYLCTSGTGYDGPTGLGTPAGTSALAPDVIAVGAGTRNSCVLRANGLLSCWGYDGAGQSDAPSGNYVALSTSDDHSCAIDTAGALHCWGSNANGMASPPVGTFVAVSAGANDTCAIDTAGALHCWGDNSSGQAVPPVGTYIDVTVGSHHACAIARTGAVTCWGDSSNGKTTPLSGTYTVVRAGANHTCGLANNGVVNCWGLNTSGQTGGVSGSGWMDIASGTNGSCALDIHGAATCWGDNSHGQNSPPAGVWSRVALGAGQGCVYGAAGVSCWGLNTDGQATPLFSTSSVPQEVAGASYSADVALSTTVVPSVSFTVTSGSLPPGISLSTAGHFSGSSSTPGSYPFTVTASNGMAPSATANLSIPVVTLPSAPTGVTATRGNVSALVSWTAPNPGSSSITGYTVTASSGSFTCTTTGATSCVVTGLTNGVSYTFTVTATNGAGTGPASSPSNAVTPDTVPDAPTNVVATRGNSSASVTWTAPSSNGGGAISLYTVTSTPGGHQCTAPTTAGCTVGGLTNGTSYTFTVAATNDTGTGLSSDPSAPITAASNPGAPTGVTGIGSDSQVVVSWTAPASNGSGIISYTVTASPGPGTCSTNGATTCIVTGLTNRQQYHFSVVATNGVGAGPASGLSSAITPLFGSTYFPVTPNRLVDSRAGSTRTGLGATLSMGVPAEFQVTGRVPADPTQNVPDTATAVTGNLTVVGQTSLGYLSLTPARPAGIPATSTLNVPLGDIRANGVTVQLGSDGGHGVLWVTFRGDVGSRTDVVFDVTGYFVPNATGATYVPIVPNRLVDSRAGTTRTGLGSSLTASNPASFQVTGRVPSDPTQNVPSSATAVTGNLTVVGQTSLGYLSLTPARPAGIPATSTLNFPLADIRANGVAVPLGPGGVLWVTFRGDVGSVTDVVFDVTGYFTM